MKEGGTMTDEEKERQERSEASRVVSEIIDNDAELFEPIAEQAAKLLKAKGETVAAALLAQWIKDHLKPATEAEPDNLLKISYSKWIYECIARADFLEVAKGQIKYILKDTDTGKEADTMGNYNGYTNRETYKTHLIIDNTEPIYTTVAQEARRMTYTPENIASLANLIKDIMYPSNISEVLTTEGPGRLYNELFTDAVSVINWHEVAARFIEDEGRQ